MAIWFMLILSAFVSALLFFRWSKMWVIYRWRRALALDQHHAVYLALYQSIDGFLLSKDARKKQDAMEYVYGEIDFLSFIALLSLTQPDRNTIFYDLGSGTGKAVLACSMVFQVQESHGVELFASLHDAACGRRTALALLPHYAQTAKKIHLVQGDLFFLNWSRATLIFINATGFFGQRWVELSAMIEQSTACKTVITTSKALVSKSFCVTKITTVQMSWGRVQAYIQTRLDE